MTIDPKEIPMARMHALLLGSVIPRPIAFVSTVDKAGNVNLSPFSYFNCFGANPPVLIFSPARRGRDNTTKHTFENILEVQEAVVHIVCYSIVQQMSLASAEYPKGVNEFVKAGLTEVPSLKVKPPRVKEAPVAFECKVMQVIQTGDKGGAGNLVICEVIMMHLNEDILDNSGRIDPHKLDAVARLGGDWYCRVHGDAIFKLPRPLEKLGIGIDQLPAHIRNSTVLTGNDLGILASVDKLPERITFEGDEEATSLLEQARSMGKESMHQLAKAYLEQGRIDEAWRILLNASV